MLASSMFYLMYYLPYFIKPEFFIIDRKLSHHFYVPLRKWKCCSLYFDIMSIVRYILISEISENMQLKIDAAISFSPIWLWAVKLGRNLTCSTLTLSNSGIILGTYVVDRCSTNVCWIQQGRSLSIFTYLNIAF